MALVRAEFLISAACKNHFQFHILGCPGREDLLLLALSFFLNAECRLKHWLIPSLSSAHPMLDFVGGGGQGHLWDYSPSPHCPPTFTVLKASL